MNYSQVPATATNTKGGVIIRHGNEIVKYFRFDEESLFHYYGYIDVHGQWYETVEMYEGNPYCDLERNELSDALTFELDSTERVHKIDKPNLPDGEITGYEIWDGNYIAQSWYPGESIYLRVLFSDSDSDNDHQVLWVYESGVETIRVEDHNISSNGIVRSTLDKLDWFAKVIGININKYTGKAFPRT